MSAETAELTSIYQSFLLSVLLEHDVEKSLSFVADDVIGIGMGTQGVVYGKEDVARIMNDNKASAGGTAPEILFENIQVRCYEHKYATICGVLKVRSTTSEEAVESALGQLINMRKEDGIWLIYTIQATPLFNKIEEMAAYPIRFAENVLEKYRQQEQIAKNAQSDSMGIYGINFSEGICEDCVVKNALLVRVKRGSPYEPALFDSARRYLNGEDLHHFITLFSVGNVLKAYQNGQTELSMEYPVTLPAGKSAWMKTVIRLYTDKVDEQLKGYLYVIDINDEKTRALELQSKAELDPLTEVYNRKYAESKVNALLKGVTPLVPGAFFMVDLDHFKNINDTYGHKEGDHILRETALGLRSLTRSGDVAGRLGGDEFCIYFQGELKQGTVERKAERLCDKVRAILTQGPSKTSCSIGIVFCTDPASSFDEIYQKADRALYLQKNKGRNGYTIYQDET